MPEEHWASIFMLDEGVQELKAEFRSRGHLLSFWDRFGRHGEQKQQKVEICKDRSRGQAD
jgi:hypothetical protein